MANKKQNTSLSKDNKEFGKPNTYIVVSKFIDKNNKSKTFEAGEIIPDDFEGSRLNDLLQRGLITINND